MPPVLQVQMADPAPNLKGVERGDRLIGVVLGVGLEADTDTVAARAQLVEQPEGAVESVAQRVAVGLQGEHHIPLGQPFGQPADAIYRQRSLSLVKLLDCRCYRGIS